DERGKFIPCFRKNIPDAVKKPLHLAPLHKANTAQDDAEDAIGMRFGISQRQRAAPRTPEYVPALDRKMLPQGFDVLHEKLRGVIARLAKRRRTPCPTLIEDDDAPC